MINRNRDFHTDAVVIHCNSCPELINLSPDTDENARARAERLGWTSVKLPRSTGDLCPRCTSVKAYNERQAAIQE